MIHRPSGYSGRASKAKAAERCRPREARIREPRVIFERGTAGMFGVRGRRWWRQVALLRASPYYVAGALTASGSSWNASIVAEAVS